MVNKEDSINIRFILVVEPVNFSADLGFLLNHYLYLAFPANNTVKKTSILIFKQWYLFTK